MTQIVLVTVNVDSVPLTFTNTLYTKSFFFLSACAWLCVLAFFFVCVCVCVCVCV